MAPTVTKSSKKSVKLENKQATEFEFKSFLDRPIVELSVLRQSLLFAETAMISYLSIEQCNIAAGKLGFTDGKFFNCGGAQAYWFQNEFDSVVVFRGTEVHEWNDIAADVNALTALAETVGKVHRGFKTEVDDVWPHIEKALEKNTKPIWFCGHSLGGAMATICAGRCMLSYLKAEPEGLFTYGSPRVGCRRYVNYVKIPHYRWVNNNDIVTRVPPALLGYRHSGTEMYLNRLGQLKDLRGWRRVSDRIQGFFLSLKRGRIDQLSDHASPGYIDAIFNIIRSEELKPDSRYGTPPVVESLLPNVTDDSALESEKTSPLLSS
ncbi:MAG: triacylglycerol lipase [Mariniblastus sp.]|jgi:triacylglycerol lipase